MRQTPVTRADALRRWPRIVAHVIADSLGYATPSLAARIVADATNRSPNHCEWVDACFHGDAKSAVGRAVRRRHRHRDFMASYPNALYLVRQYVLTGDEPLFASWF